MEDDPFFNTSAPPVEEKEAEPPKEPEPPEELPKIEVEVLKEKKVEEKPKEEKLKKEKPKKVKKYITSGPIRYTKRQKTIATIIYLAIVISCLIIIFGMIVTVANFIQPDGKWEAFTGGKIGTMIAIIGGALAGTFFLIFFFYSLAKKGVSAITRVVFKTRELDEKYKNRTSVKLFAGAIMLSIFAAIIGIVFTLVEEAIAGGTGTFSAFLTAIIDLNMGLYIMLFGAAILVLMGLIFALDILWYNGYYIIIKMIGGLDSKD